MRFRVLGPMEINGDAGPVPITGRRRRALLAVLLLRPSRVVGVPTLVDGVWGASPPSSAVANTRTYIYELRQLLRQAGLGHNRLVSHPVGYRLDIDENEFDLTTFRRLTDSGREAASRGYQDRAADYLGQALDLWRGRPLEDVPDVEVALATDLLALEEQRRAVTSEWVDAQLARGGHAALIPKLRAMVAENPLDEYRQLQLMRALHGAGRTSDALLAFRDARRLCIDELGVEPGDALKRLHTAILNGGAGYRPPGPGSSLSQDRALAAGEAARNVPAGHGAGAPNSAGTARVGTAAASAKRPPTQQGEAPAGALGWPPPPDRPMATMAWSSTALPPQPPRVFGRSKVRDDVMSISRQVTGRRREEACAATVAISGGPGTGKTALALTLAYELRTLYPDGQVFIGLDGSTDHPKLVSDALAEILTVLAGPDNLPDGLARRIAMLRCLLDDRRVLLVLDDVTDAALVGPLLPGTGRCLAILTSRPQLTEIDATCRCNLGPLEAKDGVRLLGEAVGRDRLAESTDAALRIVAACGGLPLALRIAATRLLTCPGTPPSELAARLEDESAVLNELAAVDRSIRTRFERDYRAQDEIARRVLRRLAMCTPVFGEAAAARAAGMPPSEVSQVLAALVRANVLIAAKGPNGQQCFEMPRLLRLFVREQGRHRSPRGRGGGRAYDTSGRPGRHGEPVA